MNLSSAKYFGDNTPLTPLKRGIIGRMMRRIQCVSTLLMVLAMVGYGQQRFTNVQLYKGALMSPITDIGILQFGTNGHLYLITPTGTRMLDTTLVLVYVDSSRASHVSDSAKILYRYILKTDTTVFVVTKKALSDTSGVMRGLIALRQAYSDTATWDETRTSNDTRDHTYSGSNTFQATVTVGVGMSASGYIDFKYIGSNFTGALSVAALTDDRDWFLPDRGGTVIVNGVLNDSLGGRQRNSDTLSWDASKTFASNASNLTSGTVGTARLGSGVADASTVLLGNGTWGPAVYSGASNFDSLGVSSEGAKPVIKNTWYNNTTTNSPLIMLRKATNTTASPTLVLSGHYLGTLAFGGYGTSQWMNASGAYAGISGVATENFSNTNMGTKLIFQTYGNSAGGIKSMTMEQDGSLTNAQWITTPIIYGSTASGGDLKLYSTSHATRGTVEILGQLSGNMSSSDGALSVLATGNESGATGAYYSMTGVTYSSGSPGYGSAEYVIRNSSDATKFSRFDITSYSGSTWTQRFRLTGSDGNIQIVNNVGIGFAITSTSNTSFAASADKTLQFKNGTAPSASLTDGVIIWSGDNNGTAGHATLQMRNENYAGTQTVAGTIYKTTTGDPSTTVEGTLCINTFDNTYKVYADGAWRTIITW